uniref:Prokineticin 1 n=1 Tax=Terrapene triunguis TaxID=2587831 RepID=A0A674J439_9SAUR
MYRFYRDSPDIWGFFLYRLLLPPHPSPDFSHLLSGLPKLACERDLQCGAGTCCAISLWLRGLRMCTPLGQEGDECHPFSHKVRPKERKKRERENRLLPKTEVPFLGKRQHHTCPCLPNFICSRFMDGRFRCSVDFKNIDF